MSHCHNIPDQTLSAWIRDIRRQLHQIPEKGFAERKTARFIHHRLAELGISYRTHVAETGIVAELGPTTGPCIALRADMDGLPIEEKTGLPFASKHPGMMHACGHDGHMAMLLGAAALLCKQDLAGRVRLLFQPAEEGQGGATRMIAENVLNGVDAIFSGHLDRHFKTGELGVEPGLICAYTDSFSITITGKGGHAAKPHETVDSIVVASLLVMSLQTLVSREVNPSFPTVVTVGKIHGGSAVNVIAAEATLEGTIRTTHWEVRQTIINGLTRMVEGMQDLYQVKTSLLITAGYPPIINDPAATAIARSAARMVVGDKGVKGLPQPSLGGEDFSYYLHHVPGCFVRIGAQKSGLENIPAHSPGFDFDEAALPVGAAFLAQVATLAMDRISELCDS